MSGSLPKGVQIVSAPSTHTPPVSYCLLQGYLDGVRPFSAEERPQSPSAFLEDLEDLPGFANPSSSENLKGVLGVWGFNAATKPSLIRAIQK